MNTETERALEYFNVIWRQAEGVDLELNAHIVRALQQNEKLEPLVEAVRESIMEMKRHGVCCRKFLEDALAEYEKDRS